LEARVATTPAGQRSGREPIREREGPERQVPRSLTERAGRVSGSNLALILAGIDVVLGRS
jgi:hypothetical protein